MKEIIEWLLDVEKNAESFYREVAFKARDNNGMAEFFLTLANEEAWHLQVMQDALAYLEQNVTPAASIIVDRLTKEKIGGAFERNRALLAGGNLSMGSVLDCLATTEFSEWNDIFIYVVNILKEERRFMAVAARIHRHVKEVEGFLESLPEGRKYLYLLRSLPAVWQQRMLIIDDDQATVQFLQRLFSHDGHVETAANGKEGLEKLREDYFDVIITDLEMPVMDGIEFYRRASSYDPDISEKILLFTGSSNGELGDFLKRSDLKYLAKPAPIREIIRKVAEITSRVRRGL